MNLVEVRQHIIDRIVVALSDDVKEKSVAAHRGQFKSLEEIQNSSIHPPTVLVAYRGFKNATQHFDQLQIDSQWLAIVITKNKRGIDKDEQVSAIATKIAHLVANEGSIWPFSEDEPKQVSGNNQTILSIDKAGLAMWAVNWTQTISVSDISWPAVVADFAGYDADHFTANADTQTDQPNAQTKEDYSNE